MRIDEFTQSIDRKMPFNPVDDCAIYMRNDPMFYRKTFFPAMADVSDRMEKGDSIDPAIMLKPIVDQGVKGYCKKYIKDKRAEDVFTEKDKKACVDKISAEEMPNIKKGMYKVEI